MTLQTAILCCLVTSFGVHYGWKMRGTVIGGEKGAMLPGLIAGLSLALFAGGEIAKYFWIPAAAGLIGMSYGGIEPYGDTIAFINSPHYVEPDPKRGFAGLSLKGALWFGVGGGYIGLALSSMGGTYKLPDILLFPLAVIVLQSAGYGIFNQPYDEEKGKTPRIYFAFESREEWGSNVGVIAAILLFACIRKDILTLAMVGGGLVFGAIGWFVAMNLYIITETPLKRGKYLFGKLAQKELVGGWGNMEYCLGSFGGLGLALAFVLCRRPVALINQTIAQKGLYRPVSVPAFLPALLVTVLFFALFLFNFIVYHREQKGEKFNNFHLDLMERPLFNTLPFVLVFFCSVDAAKLLTAFMLIWVLCIKTWFDRFEKDQHRTLYIGITAFLAFSVYVCTLWGDRLLGFAFPSPMWVLLCGTVPYLFSEIFWNATCKRRGGIKSITTLNGISFSIAVVSASAALLLTIWALILY